MRPVDRTWLLDLDNVIGSIRPRPRVLRTRVRALLEAAGPLHHAVAGYAVNNLDDHDPVASILAELGIAPLRVARRPDAAELALIAHAHHVHAQGGRVFLVSSADRKFTELRGLGRLELLIWTGQPVAAKLAAAAHQVQRLPRPTGLKRAADDTAGDDRAAGDEAPEQPTGRRGERQSDPDRLGYRPGLPEQVLTAVMAGVGMGLGHRLAEAALTALRRERP